MSPLITDDLTPGTTRQSYTPNRVDSTAGCNQSDMPIANCTTVVCVFLARKRVIEEQQRFATHTDQWETTDTMMRTMNRKIYIHACADSPVEMLLIVEQSARGRIFSSKGDTKPMAVVSTEVKME